MAAPGPERFEGRQLSRFTWDQRIERARQLAQTCASASELLRFYEQLAGFQKSLYEKCQTGDPAFSRSEALGNFADLLADSAQTEFLLTHYPDFLRLVASAAPEPLAAAAQELLPGDREHWRALLIKFCHRTHSSEAELFLGLAYLQPCAEWAIERVPISPRPASPVCPGCGAEAVCGVLRPEGHGARRSLICSLCANEWHFPRVVCFACNEKRADALPAFTAEQEFEHVRIEACDTCKHYIKTVDLTKNGLAVPVVDEVASISLSLWAQEKGYRKVQPNLFGL